MGAFLLKSSIALLAFLSYYWFVLRRDTTFHTNRIYLLSTLIISVLIPWFDIDWNVKSQAVRVVNDIITPIHIVTTNSEISSVEQTWWTLEHILFSIYAIGTVIFIINYFRQIVPWLRLIPKGDSKDNSIQIVKTNKSIPPFSFINTIFLGNQEFNDSELNKIISHEKQHILQYHWIDLLIVDVLSILLWFNPLIWIYDLLIKQNHEYLADNGVIAQGFNKSSYQALLLQQVVGVKIPGLSSSFTQSLIKNRFIMMTKKHSRKITGMKAMFAVPLLLFLTMLFASNNSNIYAEVQKGKVTGYVYDINSKKPLEGASVILKEDSHYGTSTNANGYFKFENPYDNAHLVISYVGYETEKVKVSKDEVKIMMKRAKYTVSLKESEVKGEDMYGVSDAPPPPPPAKQKEEQVPPPPPPKDKKEGKAVKDEVPPPPPPKNVQEEELVIVEEVAMPQGGFKGLSDYIFNEIEKCKNKYEGLTTDVFFVVNEKGKVTNVKIEKSSGNKEADKAAVNIIENIPDWKPAFQRNKNVSSDYTLGINF